MWRADVRRREEQPALEPYLALLPAHGFLLMDPHTVLVEEAVLRRAPRRVAVLIRHRGNESAVPHATSPSGNLEPVEVQSNPAQHWAD